MRKRLKENKRKGWIDEERIECGDCIYKKRYGEIPFPSLQRKERFGWIDPRRVAVVANATAGVFQDK